MKILWVNPHFLHPTTKGGQIRTLEMLLHLHRWHEIHYVALESPEEPEGLQRSPEYSSYAYPVPHRVPPRRSLAFLAQAAGNVFSSLPLAVSRYESAAMRRLVEDLIDKHRFDRVVCDFLFAAPNVPDLTRSVLFQHNVETTIWQRHRESAKGFMQEMFFGIQAKRMFDYEAHVCQKCAHVVTVSDRDACRIREMFGVSKVSAVPTGVNIDYFRPASAGSVDTADLVFVGSMDWLPNADAVLYFVQQILPLIRRRRPECTFAIVGRKPSKEIIALGATDSKIRVTGTVPDIRPYFWNSSVSVVPIRIGGGTRLKIFEAMAANIPVVSTTIGAEGLPVSSGENCYLADSPEEFADRCLELMAESALRQRIAASALDLVTRQFSWQHASRCFETILESAPAAN
jgi:glycosyltransferase involved in cell wall biosynthesis